MHQTQYYTKKEIKNYRALPDSIRILTILNCPVRITSAIIALCVLVRKHRVRLHWLRGSTLRAAACVLDRVCGIETPLSRLLTGLVCLH